MLKDINYYANYKNEKTMMCEKNIFCAKKYLNKAIGGVIF